MAVLGELAGERGAAMIAAFDFRFLAREDRASVADLNGASLDQAGDSLEKFGVAKQPAIFASSLQDETRIDVSDAGAAHPQTAIARYP